MLMVAAFQADPTSFADDSDDDRVAVRRFSGLAGQGHKPSISKQRIIDRWTWDSNVLSGLEMAVRLQESRKRLASRYDAMTKCRTRFLSCVCLGHSCPR